MASIQTQTIIFFSITTGTWRTARRLNLNEIRTRTKLTTPSHQITHAPSQNEKSTPAMKTPKQKIRHFGFVLLTLKGGGGEGSGGVHHSL